MPVCSVHLLHVAAEKHWPIEDQTRVTRGQSTCIFLRAGSPSRARTRQRRLAQSRLTVFRLEVGVCVVVWR